jgi:hypothetical protein
MELHYVYYAIQKDGTPKVGATYRPAIRCRTYLQWNLLEVYTCPWKCGDREIELQLQYFGKRDSNHHYATNPMFNKKHTKKTIEKISKSLVGNLPWNKGIPRTEETKEKISKTNKGNQSRLGIPCSEETKKKISLANKGKQPRLGIPCSEETKEKIRKANKGKPGSTQKLTEEDVRFIRKHYFKTKSRHCKIPNGMYNLSQLCKMFRIGKGSMSSVVNGKSYSYIK